VESEGPSVGKVGESFVASRHLQGCSPHQCRLRTDMLALTRKYWTYRSHGSVYGPSKSMLPVVNTDGLAPVRKYWTYRSYAGVYGPSKPSSLLSTYVGLKRTASVVVLGEKLRQVPWATQLGWEVALEALFLGSSASVQLCWFSVKGFPLQGVHWFKSPQLSDMSNRLFVAVFT
jgi:hypothetical protein